MSTAMLEQSILSKQYFDRDGLLLAFDGDEPVGFVHAGFGANDAFTSLATDRGVICMLMVVPRPDRAVIAQELIARAETFLGDRGATDVYAGEIDRLNPFYLGVYGGSAPTGILVRDHFQFESFQSAGFVEQRRFQLLHRSLVGFRPLVDRKQMQLRRAYHIESKLDPPTDNWWQACTIGHALRVRFELRHRASDETVGQATFWDMEPLAHNWGVHAMGLTELQIQETSRRQGLATFLLGEALRQLQSNGITMMEIQVDTSDDVAVGLSRKLDFEMVDEGVSFRKPV